MKRCNQKYNVLVFFFITTCISFSCKKYLDEKPGNNFMIPQTIADLQALLDDAATVMNQNATPAFGEASATDYFLLPAYYQTTDNASQSAYIWRPDVYNYPNDWAKSYAPIYNANYCLDMLPSQPRNNNNNLQWNNVYGSAKFFRAFYYLQLGWVYAKAYDETTAQNDLGIVLRQTSNFNVNSKRASIAETYQQIIADAMEAINYLPDLPAHPFRPSKAGAYALLSRAYLSMRNYDSAYKYSNLCLQLKNNLMDLNADTDVLSTTTTYPIRRFNKETIFYTEMYTGGFYSLVLTTRSKVDTVLYKKFEDNDLRKRVWFLLSEGYYRFRGNYTQGTIPFTGLATDEMYLVRAECNARKGNTGLQNALSDLNKLLACRYLKSSFVPFLATSNSEVLNKILLERQKELIFRGLRWPEIKRLNMEGRNIVLQRVVNGNTYTLQPNSDYYALPLPNDIVEVGGIQQNVY